MEKIKEHIHRYFLAVYGKEYFYRAPETFSNVLERWMLAIMAGDLTIAEQHIEAIEQHFESMA